MEQLLELTVIVEMEFFGHIEPIARVTNTMLGRAVFDLACQMYPKVHIVMREGARVIEQRAAPARFNAPS